MVEILKNGVLKITDGNIIMSSRNFSGQEKLYNGRVVNAKGSRTFCVYIDDADMAQQMADDGWNVKVRVPEDDADPTTYYLPVQVGFKVGAPKIVMISGESHVLLNEKTISELDEVEYEKVDLAIRPRRWEDDRNGGASRIKAYLKTMYVTIKQDEFQDEYGFDDLNTGDEWTAESGVNGEEEELPWN